MPHPMPELNAMLKQLRLSHSIEHLAQHNRTAIEKKLSYLEFLTLLLQEEILQRQNKKFQARLKRAKIRSDKTIESFDFEFNPKINSLKIKELLTCGFIEEKAPVLIVGPCGTGKSHLAQAIAHAAIRNNIDALLRTQSVLLNDEMDPPPFKRLRDEPKWKGLLLTTI